MRPVRIVELPVGASEDRVAGSLNVERALQSGERAFEPGLLAAAHRGVLYIDEVNLLSDHLVDLLLDAAAMGRNYVERDGISVSHPSRFMLIGTMNPEEGELRPQLLDRFGLMVEAEDGFEAAERAEVVRRRIAYDAEPQAFVERWEGEQTAWRRRLEAARSLLPAVRVIESVLEAITAVCAAAQVDGMRADLVIYRAVSGPRLTDLRPQVAPVNVKAPVRLIDSPAVLLRRRRFHDRDDVQVWQRSGRVPR